VLYISNAFSLSMLDRKVQDIEFAQRIPRPVDDPVAVIEDFLSHGQEVQSVVGHTDTAEIFSAVLGRPLGFNRVSVKLTPKDWLLVGQYQGPRLPEGTTRLPEGATIEWWLI
jgi:hypothetical protein